MNQTLSIATEAKSEPYYQVAMALMAEHQPESRRRDNVGEVEKSGPIPSLQRIWQSREKGWRFGAKLAVALSSIVTILTLSVTIWALKNVDRDTGLATLPINDCDKVRTSSVWLHLAINVSSCITLAASNYFMQLLISPARPEVDRAHKKGNWLEIGVMGMRNLGSIRKTRVILWCALCLSSVTIHLVFNSAVFRTQAAGTYNSLSTLDSFLWEPLDTTALQRGENEQLSLEVTSLYDAIDWPNQGYLNRTSWLNQTGADCKHYYTSKFSDGRAAVVQLFTNHTLFALYQNVTSNVGNPYILVQTQTLSNPVWITDSGSYCLSKLQHTDCALQISISIVSIVTFTDLLKTGVMMFALLTQLKAPLITIGDAVASFLEYPDPWTEGKCLQARPERIWSRYDRRDAPRTFRDHKSRWWKACSWRYRASILSLHFVGMFTAAFISFIALSRFAVLFSDQTTNSLREVNSNLFQGFGALNPATSIALDTRVLLAALIVNTPQAGLTVLNLTYNAIVTRMLLSNEWSRYAIERRGLRTSQPRGAQRSTYWLQLPFKYSVPMLVSWTLLHWTLSQSFFLSGLIDETKGESKSVTTLFVSAVPLVTFLSGYGLLLLFLIGLGYRRFPSSMPIAGSCSLAISAACHPPDDEHDVSLKRVKWGVIDGRIKPGHCSFSSRPVSPLVDKEEYI